METILMKLGKFFPGKMMRVQEVFNTDEVYNFTVTYYLWIEDLCNKEFHSKNSLNKFIDELYNKEVLNGFEKLKEGQL